MAFWNAPLPVEQHPRARPASPPCACAKAWCELNAAVAAEAQSAARSRPLRIGIGLNTGVCFVGNMGSEQRFNYSVIGDPVNVASRIEGRCKGYGLDIVIGETTQQAARGPGDARDRSRAALGQDHGHAPVRAGRRRERRPQRAVRGAGRRARGDAAMPIARATGTPPWPGCAAATISARAMASPTSTRLYGLRIAPLHDRAAAAGLGRLDRRRGQALSLAAQARSPSAWR